MKTSGKSSGSQILGVTVDGTDMKIAQLGWEKGELTLYGIETVVLPSRLGKIGTGTPFHQPEELIEEGTDIFGIEEDELEENPIPEVEQEEEGEQQGLSGTLINVFAKYPLNKSKIAVNVPEGQASYYSFESEFGLKGKKLQKRIRDEISPLSGGTLDSANIDHFKTDSDGMMVVVSEGNIPIIEELIDIKNYLAGGVPYFCHVGSNEIALINLVRMTMDPQDNQITALVYIGSDFSRIIIMKGHDPISIIQAIREGYHSPGVCQTLFSKILLEQEEAGIPDIDQIILAGEIGIPRAVEFFQKQFPDTDVKPITPGPLDTSMLKAEEIALFPNFAIPVALAWEALDKKSNKWIRTNLMPHAIKDAQKTFRVAWHGIALLGFIFLGMVLLSYQGFSRLGHIKSLEESIRVKQASNAALQGDLIYINELQQKINVHKSNLEFLNNIIGDPDRWSRLFEKLSVDFERVKRIWIEQILSNSDGFTLIGKAVTRDRIPDLADGFDAVDLKRVTRVISESGEIAYEFEFTADLPPPPPDISIEKAVTTDRAVSTTGSINTESNTIQPSKRIEVPEENIKKEAKKEKQNVNQKVTAAQPQPKPRSTDTGSHKEPPKLAAQKEPQSQPVVTETNRSESRKTTSSPQPKQPSQPKALVQKPENRIASASTFYEKGIKSIQERKIDEALTAFKALLKNYPNCSEAAAAQYWIGECYFSLKDFSNAAQAFEANLNYNNNPKRPAGMVMLGMSYMKLGNKEKARKQFEALVEAYPEGEFTETAKRKLAALDG